MAVNVPDRLTIAQIAGSTHSHSGSRSTRTSFAYGKEETMASAYTVTRASCAPAPNRGPTRMSRASTAAAIVVGTPQKKRPSLGETLNRASRIAAQAATRAQAAAAAPAGTEPASEA